MSVASLRNHWRLWVGAMDALNRLYELRNLVRWAQRRGLAGPRDAYRWKLAEAASDFFAYRIYHPRLVRWVARLHRLNRLLNPPPRWYRKGAAARYARQGRRR